MDSVLSSGSRRPSKTKSDARRISGSDHEASSASHRPNENPSPDVYSEASESDRLLIKHDSDPPDTIDYPDGGLQAWSVVAGSFCGMFACFGVMNSIGTFEAYISTHQLSELSPFAVGSVSSLYVFLVFFCGAQVGPVFDAKGPRALVFSGSILLLLSMFLLGSCTGKKVWHP